MPRIESTERTRSRRLWLDVDEAENAHQAEPSRRREAQRPRRGGQEPPRTRRSRGRDRAGRPRRRWRVVLAIPFVLVSMALGAVVFDQVSDRLADDEPESRQGAGNVTARVSDLAADGVVAIRVEQSDGTATGSGFVIDEEGTLVTNAHVVAGATAAAVQFEDEGASFPAQVLGTDPSSDLAVLRVDPAEVGELDALELADSDLLDVGDRVVAIGHPLGLETTTSDGTVSGLDREIRAPNGFTIAGAIQTDARLLPGNSGGPLLDDQGRVVGVASQVAVPPPGLDARIGFAVPSNTVREVLPELERGERVEHAFLGVVMGAGASGVEIEGVTGDGPADSAGLRPGDLVTAIDGQPVGAADDLSAAIAEHEPGDSISLEVERAGEGVVLDVVLGTQPAAAPSPSR